jgi:hypothetical protein
MSEREEGKGAGFTVVDRRGSAAESEARPEPAAEPGPRGARFDFAMLVHSFAITALHHMGKVADPATGQPGKVDLALARQNIEIIEILEQKTRGNLDAEESHLLSSLLYEVRMHYVEASKPRS